MELTKSGIEAERLAQEITALTGLSVKELKERWRALYGTEPHRRMSRELLTRAVAYRLQERALGGLKRSTFRLLRRIADEASTRGMARAAPARKASAGTVLIRDWRGTSHRVMVLDDAVVYRAKALPLALGSCAPHNGQPLVGTLVLWLASESEGVGDGAR